MSEILPTEPVASETQQAPAKSAKEVHQNKIYAAQKKVLLRQAESDKTTAAIAKERENLPEYDKLVKLKEATAAAGKALAQAEANSEVINGLKDERSADSYNLKNAKAELSILLVKFMATYSQRSVTVNYEHREIQVSAKLGDKTKDQTVLKL